MLERIQRIATTMIPELKELSYEERMCGVRVCVACVYVWRVYVCVACVCVCVACVYVWRACMCGGCMYVWRVCVYVWRACMCGVCVCVVCVW